jgi:DNA-binding NarL/FixJ family response regulator
MKIITILLAEDHEIVRDGLQALIEIEKGIKIVGYAKTGREAVRLAAELKPDIVVMDIAMPHLNGLEATSQILKAAPNMKIIILSAHSDDEYVEQTIKIGVKGYLIKQTSAQGLFKAIREVQKGNTFFSPSIAKRINERHQRSLETGTLFKKKTSNLSSREREVLQLIAEGYANKQVAAELNISIKTVEKHRQHLMEKLNIHDIAGLTRYAISTGIIESSIQLTII